VIKLESKALRVAEELRARAPCARKEIVPRAAADGDGRSLAYLRPLVAPKACPVFRAPPECSCFSPQDRAAISAAVEAIQKRDAGEH
jgi:hypothetical protein